MIKSKCPLVSKISETNKLANEVLKNAASSDLEKNLALKLKRAMSTLSTMMGSRDHYATAFANHANIEIKLMSKKIEEENHFISQVFDQNFK